MNGLTHFFRYPGISDFATEKLVKKLQSSLIDGLHNVQTIQTELCFNVELENLLSDHEFDILKWILSETWERENFGKESFLERNQKNFTSQTDGTHSVIVEVGPRLSFSTAWSTNAVTICHVCGLKNIIRIEKSTRYLIVSKSKIERKDIEKILEDIHDKMTETEYQKPLNTFHNNEKPQPVQFIPILEKGRNALEEINQDLGLAFDEQDMEMYLNMFKEMKRNPTNVELFDLAQSNSEHSRHWFFRGKIVIDGKEMPESLMDVVKKTLTQPSNSVLAFCDNSSAIKGFKIKSVIPLKPGEPSSLDEKEVLYHLTFTAETHNFPTGVAPFPGAETGTGGRIRDVHAIGKGGLVVGGTSAYCIGNLYIPNYTLPWEDPSFKYPDNIAKPLKIIIDASNGASDYGNKFGEPVIQGYCRSFGLNIPNGERREWVKPIMFTGGVGQVDDSHLIKASPEPKMLVIKIGGPAYRIGIGGGAASSVVVHGENKAKLDFNAVQRGDAEMEQKLNRVIKACVELGESNPIISIHDQGAGGSGNVLKEIVDPQGAKIHIRNMKVGDKTLSILELWGAEYQENDALLIQPQSLKLFESICSRERLPMAVLGEVTGDGKVVVIDDFDNSTPVDLELTRVLGKMPPKTFHSQKLPKKLEPLRLPEKLSLKEGLERVLRLVSVGSKLFLTNKVDRSVTGLIAQQQCVGSLQLPLSNVAVIAQSHLSLTGGATSIGEQPIKGLVDCKSMARMSVGEMLTNIVWASLTSLSDIKCSGNWMWAAKLQGEGAEMYEAALSMKEMMLQLNIAIDGGKDSLSMAARVDEKTTAKAPGMLTISGYATCDDITKTITPDIKYPGKSKLYLIDLGEGKDRMGGSALAQVYQQIGNESPDVDNVETLKNVFNSVQELIKQKLISSGHDRSDGGLIVTLLEMAFAGNCGLEVVAQSNWIKKTNIDFFFNEELGIVLEISDENEKTALNLLNNLNISYKLIAITKIDKQITIKVGNEILLGESMPTLRDIWNETSYQLELLQANPKCVEQENSSLKTRSGLSYKLGFNPKSTPLSIIKQPRDLKMKVAVIREEGTNGDREMAAALYLAGLDPWDITMSDLIDNKISLDRFSGLVLPGGFSYADVLGSSKGWSAGLRFANGGQIWKQFQSFYIRENTWSLGVCNGCQLMALLGWIPSQGLEDKEQPRFVHNISGRFESRFSAVKILPSPSVLLKGMENSILGVWVAHGEGLAYFPQEKILKKVLEEQLAPIRYVDDSHEITEKYPFNPNGSPLGIASLCSPDGRHLAIMPHPERTVLKWQWPHKDSIVESAEASPWLQLFQNAKSFGESQNTH